MLKNKTKTISYDLETSYTVGAVWGLFDTNVATTLREPYIITIAWKVLGEKKTYVKGITDFPLYKKDKHSDKALVQYIKDEIFGKADILIAHNGNSFDKKWVYGRFVVNGITPPPPVKHIDTKLEAKKIGRFNSNSLTNLGQYFGLGKKLETGGIQLWVDCIEHNKKEAWVKMKKYNVQDVILLEKVYLKLRPYMLLHPNLNVLNGDNTSCPNCGSHTIQKRGFGINSKSKYQRLHCQDCSAWFKGENIKCIQKK